MIRIPSVKILVAYHKPARLIKNRIMTPIHVGRALARPENDPDGVLASMIGDNTGDNISLRNPYFSEMTAVYWAWKNYAALGDPDYIGLAHYRRVFAFGSDKEDGYFQMPAFRTVKWDHYDEKKTISVVAPHDLIVRSPIPIVSKKPEENGVPAREIRYTVMEQYAHVHTLAHLELAMSHIRREFPDYREDIEPFLNAEMHYMCNMFVMKRNLFFEYAPWMFNTLLALDTQLDYASMTPYQQRGIGFLAERLTGLFAMHVLRKGALSVKHVPGIDII